MSLKGDRIAAVALAVWLAGCVPAPDPSGGPSPFVPGEERTIGGDATTQAEFPDVTWGGEDFFVTWNARRVGGADLFGLRVSPRGDLVGGAQTISAAPNNQARSSVAWGDGQFLAVWEDSRRGANEIFGTWISARGAVLDQNGFELADSRNAQSAPVAVWTGRGFFVVWTEEVGGTSGRDLYYTIVQPGVSSTAPQSVPIVNAPGDQSEPAVAWGPSGGLLVWNDLRNGGGDEHAIDLYAAVLDADGRRRHSTDLAVSEATDGQRMPVVAWDRERFVVLWIDQREGNDQVYGARITPDGRLLDPSGIKVTRGAAPAGPPTLVAMPSGSLVGLWMEIGPGQHLLVGQVWDDGFGGLDRAAPGTAPHGRSGALAYVSADRPSRPRGAATERGELLVAWAGKRAGGGLETQIMMRVAEVKPSAPP